MFDECGEMPGGCYFQTTEGKVTALLGQNIHPKGIEAFTVQEGRQVSEVRVRPGGCSDRPLREGRRRR